MTKGQFLRTVGIEYEGLQMTVRQARGISDIIPDAHVTSDASVEYRLAVHSSGLGIIAHNPLARTLYDVPIRTRGYEIVSDPMLSNEIDDYVAKLIWFVTRKNEFYSPRASVHVHVGYAYNLELAKNALALGLVVDPLLFAIAGMGNPYRGEINNSIYCRPLEAGVAIPRNGDLFHLLPEQALDTGSLAEFWRRFFLFQDVLRYHPGRYFATNLYAILLHGTLEFRHFNQSLNPKHISAIVHLVQKLTELAATATLSSLRNARQFSIHEMSSKNVKELLTKIFTLFDTNNIKMSGKYKDVIQEILDITPCPRFPKIIPLTHSPSHRVEFLRKRWMVKLEQSQCCHSGHVDIHNIKNMTTLNDLF